MDATPVPNTVGSSLWRDEPTPPSPPTKGGEGRGEEGCLPNSEAPLPNPLPVRASRGEGEDRCLPGAVLNSMAVGKPRLAGRWSLLSPALSSRSGGEGEEPTTPAKQTPSNLLAGGSRQR